MLRSIIHLFCVYHTNLHVYLRMHVRTTAHAHVHCTIDALVCSIHQPVISIFYNNLHEHVYAYCIQIFVYYFAQNN